jgi:transposase
MQVNRRTTQGGEPMEELTTKVRTLGIDLSKHVFEVAGEDRLGTVVFRRRLKSREAFWRFLQEIPAGMEVLMETGPGAQAWSRMLLARGVRVRLLPGQHTTKHRSADKNDSKDVHGILRAGHDRSVHPVPVKSVEQLTMQALHRVREGCKRRRAALSNQIRGFLLEHGIAVSKGDAALSRKLDAVLEDATVPLPDRLRELIADSWAEHQRLCERLASLDGELSRIAATDPIAKRLMTVPGIGPVTSSALACKGVEVERFANARRFAAYFGMVPNQHSSGAKVRLGRMSCRGDAYIRTLAIEGAQAVIRHVTADTPASARLWRWKQRHGSKGAAVRLANRNLRIVWALLRHERDYELRVSR